MESKDIFQLFVSLPALVINIIALVVLLKSRKLPYQIRILSLNLCSADCLSSLFLCIDRRAFEIISGKILEKYFLILIYAQTSLIFITYFNLDRFLAFMFAMKYYNFLSATKVKIACALAWAVGPLMTSLQFCAMSYVDFCDKVYTGVASTISEYFFFAIFSFNLFMFAYIVYKIRVCMFRVGPTRLSAFKPQSRPLCHQLAGQRTFRKIVVITGTFLSLYAPGMGWTLIKPFVSNSKVVFYMNMCTGIFFTISTILNPIFYVLRFSECRFQILLFRHLCNREKYEEVLRERNKHYATYSIDLSLSQPEQPDISANRHSATQL